MAVAVPHKTVAMESIVNRLRETTWREPSRLALRRRAERPRPSVAIETPQLSVVIVNYCQWRNTARLTQQLRQCEAVRRGAAEIVIVDNRSPKDTIARKLRKLSGVSVVHNRENQGFAKAVNRGGRLSRGEWVLLLNPDVTVPPGFLDAVLESAQRSPAIDPNLGVIGFQLRNRDGSKQASSGAFPSLWRTLFGLLRPRGRRKCQHQTLKNRQSVEWVTGGCLLVRRDCFEQLEGMDESYFLYYEDVDFCRRAAQAGWSIWYEPALRVTHHFPLHTRGVSPGMRLVTPARTVDVRLQTLAEVAIEIDANYCLARSVGPHSISPLAEQARRCGHVHRDAQNRWRRSPRTCRFIQPTHSPGDAGVRVDGRRPRWTHHGMRPTLSIVIPSHSRADLLENCLASVMQFCPPCTEIIVVDDASIDGIVSQTASQFAGVRVIRLDKRSGFAVAANLGVRAATAEIVELLNDDTVVTAGWAEAVLPLFERTEIVAVAPLVLRHLQRAGSVSDGQGNHPSLTLPARENPSLTLPARDVRIDSAGDEYDPGGFARKRFHGQLLNETLLEPGPVWGAAATAAFYRKAAFLAVGGFEESFRAYFEDVDCSRKLRDMGGTIWHTPDSQVWHRISASYGRRPNEALLRQQSCNEERLFWRSLHSTQWHAAIPRHIAVLMAKLLRRIGEGRAWPWILGRLAALRYWPNDWSEKYGLPE